MTFRVDLDDREMRRLLLRFGRQEVDRLLRKASTRAGTAMKAIIRPAVPVKSGNLRRTVRAARIRSGIGVVVGPMGKKAWYRHFVVGGTKPHVIRGKPLLSTPYGVFAEVQHRGAKANPFLDRVDGPAFAAGEAAVMAAIDEALRKP